MSTYLVTAFTSDPDDGITEILDGDDLDARFAEFRVDPRVRDGAGLLVRKAGYMAPLEAALRHIDFAADPDERRRRKAEVFSLLYGADEDALGKRFAAHATQFTRHGETVTSRMVRPPEVSRGHLSLVLDPLTPDCTGG